ncbi:hypothetical protein [Paenibacillus sp. SORGH_AS_0306]|uniref:hypothetical protein n=1 Tax=unclassified Paenibacillus TaxID=185978 RepID=UPI0035937B99
MFSSKIANLLTFLYIGTVLFVSATSIALADANKLYEYDSNGRLISTTTTTEKTVFSYDGNGNLLSKQVTKGDYNSIILNVIYSPSYANAETPSSSSTPVAPSSVVAPPIDVDLKEWNASIKIKSLF